MVNKFKGLPAAYDSGTSRQLTVNGVKYYVVFKQGKPVKLARLDATGKAVVPTAKRNNEFFVARFDDEHVGISRYSNTDGNVWFLNALTMHSSAPDADMMALIDSLDL